MTPLQQTATTQSYKDVENLIYQRCLVWQRRNGGDIDELVSVAHEGFAKAYESFDKSVATWSTWVYHNIETILQTHKNRERRRREHISDKVVPLDGGNQHWLVDFLDELTTDAKTVVEIVLESPAELWALCSRHGNSTGTRDLKNYLKQQGWTHKRARNALDEIKEALEN